MSREKDEARWDANTSFQPAAVKPSGLSQPPSSDPTTIRPFHQRVSTMSDPSPPPKKPGSLRDKIAAFENRAGQPPLRPAVAPPPAPKTANTSIRGHWKPLENTSKTQPTTANTMSSSDAQHCITGTLKDRMAALQGKGAFGSPPSQPQPEPIERPLRKSPPQVMALAGDDDDASIDERVLSGSPPRRHPTSPFFDPLAQAGSMDDSATQEEDEGVIDREAERQRRAAITARLARLGGTRIGMAPPVFAPKQRPSSPPIAAEQNTGEPDTEQGISHPVSQPVLMITTSLAAPLRRGSIGLAWAGDENTAQYGRHWFVYKISPNRPIMQTCSSSAKIQIRQASALHLRSRCRSLRFRAALLLPARRPTNRHLQLLCLTCPPQLLRQTPQHSRHLQVLSPQSRR